MIDGELAGLFTSLLSYASMFPPQDELPSPEVADNQAHRMACYADMVGPFVCSAGRLSTINDLAARHGVERLAVAVVVPGGLQALLRTVDASRECQQVRLTGIEVPLGPHSLV